MVVAAMLLALFVYAAAQSAAQSYHLRQDERALQVEVNALRQRKAELEGLRTYVSSDAYVEAEARSRFKLVRPGETLVEVDAPSVAPQAVQPGERWWESVFGR